jgi:hypothetical protein
MEVGMLQKFGDVDLDELREKMGAVKEKLQQQVQHYF